MPRQYAAIVAEVIPAETAMAARGPLRQPPSREKLSKILKHASRVQQRELKLGIVPYNVTPGGEFFTATANLEGLPWILLDLRGRLQPFLLRIGVGIGELDGHFRQPARSLTGRCLRLAHEAVDSLRAEQLLAHESCFRRKFERQDARDKSRAGGAIRGRLPLTRFRTVNFDFDAAVNEICKLQDSLIHKMHRSEWAAFVPKSASRRRIRGRVEFRPHREHIRAQHRTPGSSAREPLQAFRRAYFAQLMAAAAGVQHLISERFLFHWLPV
jgi:hypothetical protein